MTLPTEKTPIVTDLSKKIILLYGTKKVGKTEFASNFPDVLFLCGEKGQGSTESYQLEINCWEDLERAYHDLREVEHPFKTIAMDTIEMIYGYCEDYVCREAGEKYITEGTLGYGKGRDRVNKKMRNMLTALSNLSYGLVIISHSREVDIIDNTGDYTKVVPGLYTNGKKSTVSDPCSFVVGMADLILYCCVITKPNDEGQDVSTHLIKTRPNKYYEAGCRMELPPVLPLNYKAFYEAYTKGTK